MFSRGGNNYKSPLFWDSHSPSLNQAIQKLLLMGRSGIVKQPGVQLSSPYYFYQQQFVFPGFESSGFFREVLFWFSILLVSFKVSCFSILDLSLHLLITNIMHCSYSE